MTRVKYAMALLGLVGMFTGTPARGQSYPVYWDAGQGSYRWAQNLIDFATETWVLLQGFVSTADPDWNAEDWNEAFLWGDHLGLYLPILGTARSALKLVSENGMSWIEVSHGTGTFYTVSVTSTDTNTIVLLESDGYNGGTPPWVFDWSTEDSVVWSNPGGRVSWDGELGRWMHYSLAPGDPWIWHSQTNNALDSLPIILFPAPDVLGNRATGTMKIDYLRTYVTNSIEFVAIADDYYDKATTDFRIAAAVAEIEPDPAIRDSLWYITTEGYLSPKTEPIDFGDHWELSDGDWGYLVTTDNVTADVLWRVNEFGDLVANHEVSP